MSDHADEAGEFSADSDVLSEQFGLDAPDVIIERLDLDESDLEGARSMLIDRLGVAGLWSNYLGHGGGGNLSKSDLLVGDDIARISGGSGVLNAMTCVANLHDSPHFQSIGESLVLDADGGPGVSIGPSGLSLNGVAVQLNAMLLDEVFANGQPVLGEAVAETMYRNADAPAWQRQIINLIGDVYLMVP